ncbi:MAG: 2-oxoacid:acceptor oxidoreductase family protein [Limnochordia bacterium]|nr:2-oxoacid:acceptor oxidoreductase family protein [Limnochordia bacterium]MDD2629682.1 2-oxoacid:acceptor oxidoreductase family protein [Limnochordia bacterium]MDD4517353.1 2-oxoacid:acceptor oxidoreductase family protein [Limnochordia bacterium]
MAEMLEIRWHGRGGQGAKTASILLGEAAAAAGKYIQAFPEYGPERMGAPVTSYNRLSDEPIRLNCSVTNPKYVVILDPTLIGSSVDVLDGVGDDGVFLVNTDMSIEDMRKKLGVSDKQDVYVINANKISLETIKRAIPNTPMLGALVRVTNMLSLEDLLEDTRRKLEKKFRNKPEIIDGNMEAITRAYQEVKD